MRNWGREATNRGTGSVWPLLLVSGSPSQESSGWLQADLPVALHQRQSCEDRQEFAILVGLAVWILEEVLGKSD
jgi:hypothetical protein